jgi:hypothetical protein
VVSCFAYSSTMNIWRSPIRRCTPPQLHDVATQSNVKTTEIHDLLFCLVDITILHAHAQHSHSFLRADLNNKIRFTPQRRGATVTLQSRIRGVLGSNFYGDTGYTEVFLSLSRQMAGHYLDYTTISSF